MFVTKIYQSVINFYAARRNLHTFDSDKEENDFLIYNYSPVFTGKTGLFEQSYLFPLN